AKADVLRIEVQRGEEGKKLTPAVVYVGVGKKVEEKKAGDKKVDDKKDGERKEEFYYAYRDTSEKGKDVVKVPVTAVEPFRKLLDDPGSMRSKQLVVADNFRTPDAIEIQNSYGKLEFRRPDSTKPWQLFRGDKGSAVDEPEVQLLISTL